MQVEIKDACKENWDLMSPKDKGRHCAKCEKTVIDFSKFTDEQIIKYLHNNTNSCGRFDNTQLSRNMELPPLVNPFTSWWKKLSVGGMLFGSSAVALAQENQSDSMITDSVSKEFIFDVKEKLRSAHFRVEVPADSTKRITKIRSVFGEFETSDAELDKDWVVFTMPKNVESDTLKTIITLADSTEQYFEVKADFKPPQLQLSYVLTYDSTWKLAIYEAPECLKINDFEIITTGGVVPDIPYVNYFDTVEWSTVTWGFTTINHLASDTLIYVEDKHDKGDTTNFAAKTEQEFAELREQKENFKEVLVHEKRSSSVWWWLLPVPLVFLIAGWQWKRRRQKEHSA